MVLVNLTGLETVLGLPAPVVSGFLRIEYWAGTGPFINVAGAEVVFPRIIQVRIIDGQPASPVELVPTDGVCCVRWEVYADGASAQLTRYTSIPATGPVDFGDLPQVDPGTFEPLNPLPPTAQEVLAEAALAIGSAAAAAQSASDAQEAAESVIPTTDAAMTAVAADEDSDFATALNATFVGAGTGGARAVALGNSIEDGSGNHAANLLQGKSYFNALAVQSAGRIRLMHNGGRSGDTMTQMLDRWDQDVTPFAPRIVFLGSGENDLKDLTAAQAIADLDVLVQKVRSIGALPVVRTCVPRTTVVTLARVVEYNLRLSRYAADEGIPLLDLYAWLVSETDGTVYANGTYTSDGTHTSASGANYIASKALAVLLPYLPAANLDLVKSANDPHNLFTNALFLTDVNADGVPDGWGSGGAAGVTRTLVTVPGVPGKMLQLDNISAASRSTNSQAVAAGSSTYQPGDTLRVAARIQADQPASAYDGIYAIFTGSTEPAIWTFAAGQGVITDGIVQYEFVVPAGTTAITFYLSTLPGVGKTRYGQPTLRNLTKLGVQGFPTAQPSFP